MNQIDETVIKCIRKLFKLPNDREITFDTTFLGNLELDESDIIELFIQFENEFNMRFSDEEVWQLKTVGDAIEYIKKNRKKDKNR